MNKKAIIYIILGTILAFSQNLNAQVKYQVNGNVFLEDQISSGSHEGVSIKFFNLPDMTLEDSTVSLDNGSYSLNISPGYYLVRWEKSGYVPEENGGLALASDVTLDDITLIQGEVLEVSGNVSGTWTTNYVYFVTDDIQVPAGFTLTINPGVKVRFSDSTNFNAYGTLKILGTEDKRVTFTSLAPSPTPGDWGKVTLYAPNNIIKYLDYSWASDGIYGEGASGTIIEHLNIDGSLKLGANGLRFTNSSNVSFKYNTITASGADGIYITSPQTSMIVGNKITGAFSNSAISANSLQSGVIDSNKIDGKPNKGIESRYSSNTEIHNNEMDVATFGLYINSGLNYSVEFNKINNFSNTGIYLYDSQNSRCQNNRIFSILEVSNFKYGINGQNVSCESRYNYINLDNYYNSVYGINFGYLSIVESDTILIKGRGDVNAIYADQSSILENVIKCYNDYSTNSFDTYSYSAIRSIGSSTNITIIKNNEINIERYGKAIGSIYSEIVENDIRFYISNNNAIAYLSGRTSFKNNFVSNSQYGLRIRGTNNIVDSNQIVTNYQPLYLNSAIVSAKHNLIKSIQGDAVFIDNQSSLDLISNTIVTDTAEWNQNQGYALISQNLSNVKVVNNTFSGFRNGIKVDNSIVNYNIKYNNLWDIGSNLFSGSAMPPLIGNMVDQNGNGDPADIYNNISFDPEFVNIDSMDYTLSPYSHLINAGDPTYKDADNTISDIGAYQHYIYVVIEHTKLKSTSDETGPYTVTAKITSPSGSTVSGKLFYSVDGGDYNELAMTVNGDQFSADIPGQPLNSIVRYYIEGSDGEHFVTSPFDINTLIYSFHITLFSSFANLSGSSLTDGTIKLTWNKPTPTEGTLTGYKLYKGMSPNFELNDSLILTNLPPDSIKLIDNAVKEGFTYYYKLVGLLNLNNENLESVVSEEVSVLSDNATIVRVNGRVILEGESDYSGVKLLFEKVSPSAIQDTFFTPADGSIDKVMHVGIYNIHISKDGYKPLLLGDRFLSSNTNLDTINMFKGGAISLAGDVSGKLTKDNLYFVDANITVPSGDTLIIEPGTEIKFRGGFRFNANGLLLAVGTENDPIIFTSGMPSPLEGDWDRLALHNAPNSIIKYCEFYYASNGILLDNSDGTEISSSIFDKHKLNSTGIEDSTFNNNSTLYINNNQFLGKFSVGIELYSDKELYIINNNIIATEKGIYASAYKKLDIEGNEISAASGGTLDYGIYCESNSDSIIIRKNSIETILDCAVYTRYYKKLILENNIITGTYPDNNPYALLLNNSYQCENNINGNIFEDFYNVVYFNQGSSVCLITNNEVQNSYRFIVSEYSYNDYTIARNFFKITDYLISLSGTSNTSKIESNSGTVGRFIHGVTNSEIKNNILDINYNGFDYVTNSIIKNNQLNYIYSSSYIFSGSNSTQLSVLDNKFTNFRNIGLIKDTKIVSNNEFVQNNYTSQVPLEINGGNNVQINKNKFFSVGSGTVLKFSGGSFANVYKNTFINKYRSGKAIEVTDNSNPIISSNLIFNYDTGIDASSSINSLKFNLSYYCNTDFSGTGIPAQAGTVVTVNNNADPSDIYSNIFLDPKLAYINDSTSTTVSAEILANSPAINAGDIDSLDIDGTLADIGAYFFNFGYLPENVKQDSTGDGFIAFSWGIFETDSLQGFEPAYKLLADANWTLLPQTSEQKVNIKNLTNNSVYSFKVRAVYTSKKSNFSKVINARPGSSTMSINPKYLIAFLNKEEIEIKKINITNSGNKEMTFNVANQETHNLNYNSAIVSPDSTFEIIDTLKGDVEGVHIYNLIIKSDDSESKIDTLYILNAVNTPASLTPNYFTPVQPTDKVFYFVIKSATLDGGSLQTGDEVALYSGDICVGAAGFNGVYPFIVKAYGAENGNGFSEEDSISFKLWDYGTNTVGKAVLSYNVGDGLFRSESFASVSFIGSIYELLQIPIKPNRFNLISSYLSPRNTNSQDIFNTISGLEISYEDNGSVYIPQYGINTIGNYTLTEGYHVFTKDSNAVLSITGRKINVKNYPIIIQAKRFNSIPYLLDKELNDTLAFETIKDKIEILQDDDGGVWIPALNVNTIQNLKPKKGYQIYINTSNDLNFTYPDTNGNAASIPKINFANVTKEPSQFKFNKTGISYTIVIKSALYDGKPIQNGDEIAVYDNDLCIGAIIWDTSKVNYISAWKGNSDINIAGYSVNDVVKFKIYSNEFETTFEADGNFEESGMELFEGKSYSKVNISANPGIIPNEYKLLQNYPNPFNPSTTISYFLPKPTQVYLVVYNILGEKVKTLVNEEIQKTGIYKVLWNGDNDFGYKLSSGVYFIRLIADDFVSVKKSILLK